MPHIKVVVSHILDLPYFDRFCNVVVVDTYERVPKFVIHLGFTTSVNDMLTADYVPKTAYRILYEQSIWELCQGVM